MLVIHDIDVRHNGMVRHAFERGIAEVASLAATNDRRVDHEVGETAQPGHGSDDGRHVGDLVFGEMPGLGAVAGDEFFLPSPS